VTGSPRGLSAAEAAARLASEGFNELPSADRRTAFKIVRDVLREPMLALLVGGGAIYLVLGDLQEAIVLLIFATVSVLITVIQESRTERVLEALRDLTSPRALVIRGGERIRIPGREVARGDLIVLGEGDRIPADAVLHEASDLQADESLLTGESVPVRKAVGNSIDIDQPRHPGGDDLPYVFSGALIVRGTGVAEVVATGSRSELGKIGQTLSSLDSAPPRLQAQVRRVVKIFALGGAAVSAVVVLLYGLLRGGWFDALLAGIAVGMSMLPEEFPVVLTVFMAMGAWRISRARVLTRRAAAIETLGAATVLCTDKTGTLTQNRMTISELRLADGARWRPADDPLAAVPADFQGLLSAGILGSAPDPHDPMEKAFHELSGRLSEHPRVSNGTLARAYPLRPELLAMSNAWRKGDAPALIAAKGAPEAIAELCRLDGGARVAMLAAVEDMAGQGMRVLGVARAAFDGHAWPDSQRGFAFAFAGLIGLADPLRPGVPEAVRQCRAAGIRVVMITGDYPATAAAIARAAGLDASNVVTGEDLAALDETGLATRLKSATVFARVMPNQKLRIVTALQTNGEVVAMTGDGVNDAPSLKAAHIGIAMGGRGTDVAREASSIVLLDDDFGSIVQAVRLGRRIYDNLRKAMGCIIAVHIPIAGMAVLPLILGFPLMLGPMHIAFIEMVIDPVCTLVFESETEEDDIMRRPPRDPAAPLFTTATVAWGLVQGFVVLALVGGLYVAAVLRGMPETEVGALTFFALVFASISLVFVNRSYGASLIKALLRPNRVLALVLAGVVLMLSLTLLWPFARGLFHFGPLHADDLLVTLGAGAAALLILDIVKLFGLKRDLKAGG